MVTTKMANVRWTGGMGRTGGGSDEAEMRVDQRERMG